jgi:hypothetical protein
MGKIKDIAVVTLLIEDIRMFLALSLKLLSIKWYECLCTLNSCKKKKKLKKKKIKKKKKKK